MLPILMATITQATYQVGGLWRTLLHLWLQWHDAAIKRFMVMAACAAGSKKLKVKESLLTGSTAVGHLMKLIQTKFVVIKDGWVPPPATWSDHNYNFPTDLIVSFSQLCHHHHHWEVAGKSAMH